MHNAILLAVTSTGWGEGHLKICFNAFTLNALYLDITLNDDSPGDMVTVPNHSILVNRSSLHRYMIHVL